VLLPLPFQVPAVQAPDSAPTYAEAEFLLLDRLDLDQPLPQVPALKGRDRRAYAWLQAAATWKAGPPANPFTEGTAERKEAEALRAFVATPTEPRLARLPLALSGSRLLLWRWMKAREAKAPLSLELRRAVETRLLEPGPPTIRGWALRHALCFTLAERDLAHFATLRQAHGSLAQGLFAGFQSLFALLDGPSPVFRLWDLPSLASQDHGLGELGSDRVWIAPIDAPPAEDVAWIIPSARGELGDREAQLQGDTLQEARDLGTKLQGRKASFAASAAEWERQGLSYFPALIELDGEKRIRAIRMGDAAPARP
jgi:hypothetical protein